jgi:hypothetical protein
MATDRRERPLQSAADYVRLAEAAESQAKATAQVPTAQALLTIAAEWMEKARALGWKPTDGEDDTRR